MIFGTMKFTVLLLSVSLLGASLKVERRTNASPPSPEPAQQVDQADAALKQGRRLLKRGHAAEALIQLQTALTLYTAAKNMSGVAATHNELGDLYLRQGHYQEALEHYQTALEGFLGVDKKEILNAAVGLADDRFNANLMLAKIGDVNFRLGKTSEALAAYGRMVVKKTESAASKVGRRFGGFGAIVGGLSTGSVGVAAPTSALTLALEVKKELDEYRVSIVSCSYYLYN